MANTEEITKHMTRDPDSTEWEGRVIVSRWVLRVNVDGSEEIAELSAFHSRGSGYRAHLNRIQLQLNHGFVSEASAPMSAVVVLDEPTGARFSRKTLGEFTLRAIAALREPANMERFAHEFNADNPALAGS